MVTVTLTIPPGLRGVRQAVAAALPEIAEAIRGEIVALAQRELTTAGADYVQGLHVIQVPLSPGKLEGEATFATLVLTGWLANAVEKGWAGGDMKPFLLEGRNAKTTKDGKRYNVVRFRHGTPGSSGRSFAAMGEVHAKHGMSRADAEQLGKRVHKAAKKLAPTTSHPQHGTSWGGRLPEGTGNAPRLTNRTSGYRHKTDIFAGMVRKEKTYAAATQSHYETFRAVSDNSDPGAWVHPGIIRHDFFGKAAKRIPALAALIFDGILAGMQRGGA
jgi:hypothetical protein